MKPLDIIVLSAAAYSAYKVLESKNLASDLRGEYNFKITPKKAENRNLYKLDDSIFRYLEDPVQAILLQCFAHDYTAPRMIADDGLYRSAVAAANKTGAPCGWVQIVAIVRPLSNLESSAENMLRFCDDYILKNKNNVDLRQLRNGAIATATQ
jgi:hypothetical protein